MSKIVIHLHLSLFYWFCLIFFPSIIAVSFFFINFALAECHGGKAKQKLNMP